MNPSEKLTQIAENIPKVYGAGKKAEYDSFWDTYQNNGILQGGTCDYLFAGAFWTAETCVPKYDIISPNSTYMMFALNPAVTDMREFKKANGEKFVLNTAGTKDLIYTFYRSKVTYVETIDTTSCTSISQAFNLCPIETIELLILKEDGSQNLNVAFDTKLKNITIQGTIGYNGTAFPSSVLTKESLYSIINALSATTSGRTIKLKKAAINKAFETETNLNDGVDSPEWDTLVKTKTNWTISLE